MDKYKIQQTEDGKWAILTRDYFWQRWHPYLSGNRPVIRDTIEEALRAIGSSWWTEFKVTVNSIGVY